jgi:hypothetical protein
MGLNTRIQKTFLALVLFFLVFGWLALFLAAMRVFYFETAALSIVASAIFALFTGKFLHIDDKENSRLLWLIVPVIALAVSFITCYFATPTIFGGRDQGAISTAAIYLSQNHQMKFATPVSQDLFQKYGPGKALNYPGFDYTKDGKLLSRFPVGYTSYLASAYNLFGLKGIQFANAIPLFLFLVLFWLTLSEFFSKNISFFGFLLAASFFPFLWFAKYTLTETYALFLIWTGIYFFIKFQGSALKSKKVEPFYVFVAFAALGLSALVRIEGIIFLLIVIGYVHLLARKKIIQKPNNHRYLFFFIAFFLFLYLFLNFPTLLDSLKNIAKVFLPVSSKDSGPSANLYSRLITIFLNYNLFIYVASGFVAIIYFLCNFRKFFYKAEFIPLLLLFPSLIYLFLPLITLDDPWMLRRYAFAVFPMLIFYSVYAFNKFFYHRSFLYGALAILVVANVFVSGIFLKTSENKELLPQIKQISQNFGPKDLILVDRLATGSGWSLMSEPLASIFGKQAVYFMNADDLQVIDQSRYKNIYLITPSTDEKAWYSGINKDIYKTITIDNNYLESQTGMFKVAANIRKNINIEIWKIER